MTKTRFYLIVLHCCMVLSPAVWGQCGYKASINTNHNFCIGSSLLVRADYPLERIVWYKDGQPIDSVTAEQSLASQPVKINVAGFSPIWRLTTDPAGNVYFLNGGAGQIAKWTPGGGATLVPYTNANGFFIDHSGNIYLSNPEFSAILKFPLGSTDSSIVATGLAQAEYFEMGLYVDCQGTVYCADAVQHTITKWPAGATSGEVVANQNSGGTTPGQNGELTSMFVDSNGNVFALNTGYVTEWAAGTNNGVNVADFTQVTNLIKGGITDMWMDGKDTMYLVGWGNANEANYVYKWVPGASAPLQIGEIPWGPNGSTPPGITMDIKGNIYVVNGEDPYLYELKRTSSIDTAYTPAAPGEYYAIVTDIQGYAAMTNKIVINTPGSGTPSIQISATATSTPVCTPITFTAAPVNPGVDPVYQWAVSGVAVGGDSTTWSNNLFANGDQVYCIMTAQAGCTGPVVDTSNTITLSIDPQGAASVAISTPEDTICGNKTVEFTATVTNGSNQPVFEWLVNGDSTGDDSSMFTRSNFLNGDVVTCLIVSDDACGLAKSNSIPLMVSIPPVIQQGQIFTIPRGGSLTLDPVVSGTVNTWAWSPGSWLSDSTIADPVADPPASITYTLMVQAYGGCGDTATVLVDVFTPLAIPNAFTPNGDGRNDRFYVLGGPVNSVIETFEVFNRWGQAVFQAHDAAPGDAGAGWDGRVHGSPAPTGTYVYVVVIRFATGSRQTYKGTVEVIR